MYYDWSFKPSRPREAKGGIKARSKRGGFGESWWARRWIQVLESFDLGSRLSRGRSYARGGQVLSIDIGKGAVKASVQGSRPKPYEVTIRLTPLSKSQWRVATDALAKQVLFAAKLAAGEMPPEIEDLFGRAGLSLFPKKLVDLKTDCSCPDWSNPCKHIAAAYYLLAEEFDRNPFLLFTLRGMERDELLGVLGRTTGAAHRAAEPVPESPPEPLPADPQRFWGASLEPRAELDTLDLPPVTAALLRQLGDFPFWRGAVPIDEALEPVYEAASRRGIAALVGSDGTP